MIEVLFGKKLKLVLFWATAKANTVNGECQLQALNDKKKVIIMESSIRSDLHLEDERGTDCLPTATIFEELARMGAKSTAWNKFSSTMASLIICLATNQNLNMSKYIFDAMVKHLDGGVKFLLFSIPTDSNQTPITTQPSSSRSQEKQSKRKQRKDTTVTQEEIQQDDGVPTPSNDPPLSSDDSMQLSELMILCTNLQKQVLDLEKAKDAQAKEIANLKKRVQKLKRKKKSRTVGLKRLLKVGMSRRVESFEDKDSLGDHEDASKQVRSIEDIDKDVDVSLVDDTQGRSYNEGMFDTNELHSNEVNVDIPVEFFLAQTLIQIKAAKPKVVTTAATTTTTTRPKARGVVVQDPNDFRTPQESQTSMIKDKGKAIMIEPEVPIKRNDQVSLDEDLGRNLQA
ncbi:hypothetical protein Tco_1051320 [Tanacetum coccineum]